MKVVTYANPLTGIETLKSSYPDVIILSLPDEKKKNIGIIDKVLAMQEYLRGLAPHEKVIFVDAYDVIILSQPHVNWMGVKFNAEKALWTPDLKDIEESLPKYTSDWRRLNSGVYGGRVDDLLNMVNIWAYMLTKRTAGVDDQSAAQVMFAASAQIIQIDWKCEDFQCYSFVADDDFAYYPAALYNKKTGTFPCIIHGNGKTDMSKVRRCMETGFDWLCRNYVDTVDFHKRNRDNFDWLLVNGGGAMDLLNNIRTFVRNYVWGFGEDCFAPLWWMLCDYVHPKKVLEIGVFKGQTLAYIAAYGVEKITGIGLFERGGNIPDWDFSEEDTYRIFDEHGLDKSVLHLIKGDSTTEAIKASITEEQDIVYIDGDHSYNGALSDLNAYAKWVKLWGLLVIDDCATDTQVPNGWFGGIVDVTNALRDYMAAHKNEWQFCFSLVHIKVYKRIK